MIRTSSVAFLSSAAIIVGVAITACGDDDSPSGGQATGGSAGAAGSSSGGSAGAAGGPAYPGLAQFCNALAEGVCNTNVVSNCSLPNRESCVASVQNNCVSARPLRLERFNSSQYAAALAPACVDAVVRAFTDATLSSLENDQIQAACAPAFGATAASGDCPTAETCFAPGTDCKADAECEAGFCGIISTANGPVGRCTSNLILSASEPYCDNFKLRRATLAACRSRGLKAKIQVRTPP